MINDQVHLVLDNAHCYVGFYAVYCTLLTLTIRSLPFLNIRSLFTIQISKIVNTHLNACYLALSYLQTSLWFISDRVISQIPFTEAVKRAQPIAVGAVGIMV